MRYLVIIEEINKQARLPDLTKAIKLAKQIRNELDTNVKVFDTLINEYIEF